MPKLFMSEPLVDNLIRGWPIVHEVLPNMAFRAVAMDFQHFDQKISCFSGVDDIVQAKNSCSNPRC